MYENTFVIKIDGDWYAFAGSIPNNQVYSIGADNPKEGRWFARFCDSGILYVATKSPNKSAAIKKAKRAGNYCVEVYTM